LIDKAFYQKKAGRIAIVPVARLAEASEVEPADLLQDKKKG
jgi:hypothetical protein